MIHFFQFKGIAKNLICKQYGGFFQTVIFVLMASRREMTMQRKLDRQVEKHEKNFPFQLLFFSCFIILTFKES